MHICFTLNFQFAALTVENNFRNNILLYVPRAWEIKNFNYLSLYYFVDVVAIIKGNSKVDRIGAIFCIDNCDWLMILITFVIVM